MSHKMLFISTTKDGNNKVDVDNNTVDNQVDEDSNIVAMML